MTSTISRRDFLKLTQLMLALTPLAHLELPSGEMPQAQEFIGRTQHLKRPNVLVLVFDSLSAQHMSLYGYPRSTTPNLDRFAERSFVYHAHYTAGSFTTPGTASLLTGVHPWAHRAFNLGAVPNEAYITSNIFSVFAGQGYHNLAYTHNRLADFLLKKFRQNITGYIDRSAFLLTDHQILAYLFPDDSRISSLSEELIFVRKNKSSLFLSILNKMLEHSFAPEASLDDFPRGLPEVFRASFVLENAIDGIQALLSTSPQPFLAYFHLMPPHEPYRTRKEFKDYFLDNWSPGLKPPHFFSQGETNEQLALLRRSYDEYLAYADAEFGRLISGLDRSGLLENTVVVFTSDHGQLFERGIHGHITPVLFDPLIHVPLIIYHPDFPGRKDVYSATSCLDLLPTLTSLTGGDIPPWCEGVILPPFSPDPVDPNRSIFALEAKQNGKNVPVTTGTAALIKGPMKLVSYLGYPGYDGQYELYDVHADREERVNLFQEERTLMVEMREELQEMLHRQDGRNQV